MRRSVALLALDARTGRRYGIHATAVVLAALWTAVLVAVPAPTARVLTPLVLFVDTATVGVFLVGALVLFERGEGVLGALAVCPLRIGEYVGAKASSFTLLSLGIAVPVTLAGTRGRVDVLPVVAGVATTALLLLLLALALVARHDSVVRFLTRTPWPLLPLLGVPLAHAVGLLDHPLAYAVPTTAAVDLIAAGVDAAGPPPAAVVYLLASIAAAGWFAERRLHAALRGGPR